MNYRTREDMINCTIIMEFFLMEFSSIRELQVLNAILFSLIYIAALMGNVLTIAAIVTDPHLHSPMYFFLSNLSLLDLGCISVTLPKFIVNSLTGNQSISLHGCAAQIFFFIFFAATEFAFLVAMSYDRFVAICHPLHYGVTMTPLCSLWVVSGSWLSGLLYSAVHTGNIKCSFLLLNYDPEKIICNGVAKECLVLHPVLEQQTPAVSFSCQVPLLSLVWELPKLLLLLSLRLSPIIGVSSM
ncbi:olfactory receptor 14I1-like [Vombatus ursinus]|uniref:olfactory receptor 14I1-like n=1 Tax=Vombatus ursinus TaxID=29139 RepID=UPI000FFD95F3|nr:olfactory receptor 14I1-like [Vombatus ursinus]